MAQSTSQPVTLEYMQGAFERLGREVGQKIADKLGTAIASRVDELQSANRPLVFRGNVGLAAFSAREATEIADAEILPLIGEYANNAAEFAAAGMSLEDHVRERLADVHGVGYAGTLQGYQAKLNGDCLSAVQKQSQKFAEKFPVRRGGLLDRYGVSDGAA